MLDAVTSAAYVAVLKGDPVEIGVTLGQLETIPKINKLQTIFKYRKDVEKAKSLRTVAKELDKLKPLRNAVTHGWYLGESQHGELLYALLPHFVVEDDFAGTSFFCVTKPDIDLHLKKLIECLGIVFHLVDPKELRKLFDLPSRSRSTTEPGKPRQTIQRKRPRPDQPSEA